MVEKWRDEHQKIYKLADNIIDTYEAKEFQKTKKLLKELNTAAISHVMDEDLKLFHLMKEESDTIDEKTQQSVKEFVETFKKTKIALIQFLDKYQREDEELDIRFIATFKSLVKILIERIRFEESKLYTKFD